MVAVRMIGVATSTNATPLAKRIEVAMRQAIMDAMAEGVSDDAEIKTRMAVARQQLIDAEEGT